MNLALFRFYEELNDFLPSAKRRKTFPYLFKGNPSVKDAIEAMGIPHVEVDIILVNNVSSDFHYRLRNEDSVNVYPYIEGFEVSDANHLRFSPLCDTKFIVDVHLGKLARNLRLYGFDTYYRKDFNDMEIISISLSDKRIILTRDRIMLKNKHVNYGYWVRSQNPDEQMKEIIHRFNLESQFSVFTRCIECNGILEEARKEDISDRLLPETSEYFQDFKICNGCGRIYWEGSHYSRMKSRLAHISM
jgi:uncharacterized protein with PIN domain